MTQSIEELERVLKRIEKHLDLSRAVLQCLPLVFWSAVLPLMYLVLRFVVPASVELVLGVSMGAVLSLWILLEIKHAEMVLERLELFFGRMRVSRRLYTGLQLASCIGSIALFYALAAEGVLNPSTWLLPALSLMTALHAAIDAVLGRGIDVEMCPMIVIPGAGYALLTLFPIHGEDMASIMIVSASMSLTAFLYLRRAFRP